MADDERDPRYCHTHRRIEPEAPGRPEDEREGEG